MTTELSKAEEFRLHVHEETIKENLSRFTEGVSAIRKVRDNGLWKLDFGSFPEWCTSMGFSEQQAQEWIGFMEGGQS